MGVNVEETLGSLEDRDAVEGGLFEVEEEVVVLLGFEGVEEADLREGMMSARYERERRSKDLDAGGEEFSHSDALLRMYIERNGGFERQGSSQLGIYEDGNVALSDNDGRYRT